MEKTVFQNKILEILPNILLKFNEPMAKHTSFRIGGPAEVMAFPKSAAQMAELLKTSQILDCNITIIGAGTNLLAPDEGIPGLVICMKDGLEDLKLIDDHSISVSAGVSMTRAAVFACRNGLSGLEFAHGIPGSVGGGVFMNAGAYGGEISQVCQGVTAMDSEGNVLHYSGGNMDFSYRSSRIQRENGFVLETVFSLKPDSPESIKERMNVLMNKRSNSQPLDKPSAGSAFKRPQGGYAAALIEHAGLKGFRVGDAAVSSKHAGFVINLGNATAAEVKELLHQVSARVFDNSGIRLEPEIRIL